jgi:type II secretory pathway pseudopilin PulG
MKKGCLVVVIALFAVALIGAAFAWFAWRPTVMQGATAGIIVAVEGAIDAYTAETGSPPQGDHEQIVRVLMGENPKNRNFFPRDLRALSSDFLNEDGRLVDAWRNPLQIQPMPDGSIQVLSAGPDGKFGNEDDVTSALLKNAIENLEEKT